jgi:hypothetical protein
MRLSALSSMRRVRHLLSKWRTSCAENPQTLGRLIPPQAACSARGGYDVLNPLALSLRARLDGACWQIQLARIRQTVSLAQRLIRDD